MQISTNQTKSALPLVARRALLLTAALGLPLAPAAGQCTISRAHTPDFDQRRVGLPNDGLMYCVPTSIANFLAQLSNSGYPDAFAMGSGGIDWQSNYMFQVVSTRIGQLGQLMNTHPENGTNLVGAVTGAQQWLNERVPGEFVVLGYSAYLGDPISPKQLYNMQKALGYVAPVWGRYEADGIGLTRSGGHVISMTMIRDACTIQPRITWRDPDDAGAANDIQSWFSSRTAFLNATPGLYRATTSTAHTQGTLYAFSHASNRFLDGYIAIKPLNYSTPSQTPGEIQTHNPVQPHCCLLPAVQKFQVPGNAEIIDLVNDARMLDAYFSTAATANDPAVIWKVEEGTTFKALHTTNSPAYLTTGRFGELFILDGRSLSAMDAWNEEPTIIADTLLPGPVEAFAYDDTTDTLVALSIQQQQLIRIDRHLAGPVRTYDLPSTLALGGTAALAVGPEGLIYLSSEAVEAIFELKEDTAAARFVLTDTLTSSEGTGPLLGLQVDDRNNIFFIREGKIQELGKHGATGTWRPAANSTLAGMPAHRRLAIAKSRHNFDAAIMSGPEFRELSPLEEPGIPDCYANCDGSSIAPILTVNDFTCFINSFAQAQSLTPEEQMFHYANCDESTTAPVLTVNDFTCFINAFAQGCR